MSEHRLKSEELCWSCNFDSFEFETTAEVEGGFEVIGQDRALDALNFGLSLKEKGYNIYVLNFSGPEEIDYIIKRITETAVGESTPPDLCYVHNFAAPEAPLLLKFPPGDGRRFKDGIEQRIKEIKAAVSELFTSEKYTKQKRKIKKEYEEETNQILAQIKVEVKEMGYLLVKEDEGFSITPLIDGEEPMSEEEYNNLALEEQEEIDQKVTAIKDKIELVFAHLDDLEEEYEEQLASLNNSLVAEIIEDELEALYQQFAHLEKVSSYLDSLKEDLLTNIDKFREEEQPEGLLLFTEEKEEDFSQYEVNLIVDNSSLKGAPVIKEDNPTYYNLLGRVEYENLGNGLQTNFKQIKTGALQQANGGYLILEAEKLLSNFKAWSLLKQVLKSEEIKMENLGTEYEQLPIATLLPEELESNLKVILIGGANLYYLLQSYEPEFKQLFKIKSDFDSCLTKKPINNYKLAQFISYKCSQKELLNLSSQAVRKVIEYCARRAGDKNKLEIEYSAVSDLLVEADLIAQQNNKELITSLEIEEVQKKRGYWNNKCESKLSEFYKNNKILINTQGTEIGVINALSVVDLGDYSFGRPTKITAAVYKGEEGVINIEREVDTSGKIHDKGVLILESYIGENFAQEDSLNLSARLCFEQLYTEIDGDSASSAELYALLSALAKVPLKQGIAVTGSINQKGLIQPVGGVIEKIEGFFKLCQLRGLSGEEGVIIPQGNADDLILAPEVIEAVKEEQFNIYTINDVSEGLEILTASSADIPALVQERLNGWAEEK